MRRVREVQVDNPLKRKRTTAQDENADDPKLKEFLGVMQRPSQSKSFLNEATEDVGNTPLVTGDQVISHADSEDELQNITKKSKVGKEERSDCLPPSNPTIQPIPRARDTDHAGLVVEMDKLADASKEVPSDIDWLRARTSRVLGLADDEEEFQPVPEQSGTDMVLEDSEMKPVEESAGLDADEVVIDADEQTIRDTRRLYLRNLPYTIIEDDLIEHFTAFDGLEEVRPCATFPLSNFMMIN